MGGNNVKGIYWMETIYPPPNGQSVIPPEKLQKEIQKGTIKPDDPHAVKDLDGDMDEKIDKVIREVFTHYDPKSTGQISKSTISKFFKDSLDLYAMRLGKKGGKEIIAPGVNYSQAMKDSIAKMTPGEQATYKQFEDFLNCYDIEEALGCFLNVSEVSVNTHNVQFIDTEQFKAQAAAPKKVVYREYPDD